MATETIDRVRLSQQGVLDPGEYYTAAARIRFRASARIGPRRLVAALKKGDPDQVKLPTEAIWAVTDRRLIVFNADRARRIKPTTLVISYPLGDQAYLLEVADPEKALGAGGQWTYLSLSLGGRRIDIEAPQDEAAALAHALRGYGPRRSAPAPAPEPDPAPEPADEVD